jgi:hypothetical protein
MNADMLFIAKVELETGNWKSRCKEMSKTPAWVSNPNRTPNIYAKVIEIYPTWGTLTGRGTVNERRSFIHSTAPQAPLPLQCLD